MFLFQFLYKSDGIQLRFLQLLSDRAHQNVTYHCKNSAAYYDVETASLDKAVKFQASNDIELVADRPKRQRYSVSLDECQVSWAGATMTSALQRLTRRVPGKLGWCCDDVSNRCCPVKEKRY